MCRRMVAVQVGRQTNRYGRAQMQRFFATLVMVVVDCGDIFHDHKGYEGSIGGEDLGRSP